jgi:hypothetical protein
MSDLVQFWVKKWRKFFVMSYDLWADIQAELNYQRKVQRMENDRFLRDFSLVRKGVGDVVPLER